jgi:multimeric flavodoxin WrbA
MTKQILILEGSPRKKGNSSTLAEQAAAGAREAGAVVETFYLHGLNIAPCTGCDACLKNGICVIDDDMQELYTKLAAADGLILASPIYMYTFTAQLKICLDRWYALWNGNHRFLKGKPVGIILTYGDSDLYTSGAINAIHTFETMFRVFEAGVLWVYGSLMDIGEVNTDVELMRQAFVMGKKIAS